ncbi:MauE/DoxX family redox-associated membrane protein [Spirillospora sp. NPDC029432]|uniref:MauE/DoxX family redox-associated membrane protein n=1 Tax=Spirillospora sp. NPDC029432 TaxID=3154599 RepID=UPI003454C485
MDYLVLACRALIGLVLLFAAVSKLPGAGFGPFTGTLRRAPLTARFARPLAAAVVGAEALIPVLLAVPATVPFGFAAAAVLLSGFAVFVATAPAGSSCRCFGRSDTPVGLRHLVRNAGLAAVAAAGAASGATGTGHPAGAAVALAAGAAAALLVVHSDEIIGLFAGPVDRGAS